MTTSISAYLARWGAVSQLDDGRWWRTPAGCFDEWLRTDPADVPIVVNHGRDLIDRTSRPDVLAKPAGVWQRFEVDRIGLLAHGELDDSPLGQRTAEEIRAGRMVAVSFHGQASDLKPSGETRDGVELLDLVDAVLVEAGPTPDPADPGAVIVSLGGQRLRDAVPVGEEPRTMDEALAFLESVTGERITVEDVEARRRRIAAAAAEDVAAIEALARRLAKTRRAADTAWRNTRSPWRHPSDTSTYIEADREAARLDAELREAVYNDEEILGQLCARYGILPPVSPMQRLKSLAGSGRRRSAA